LGADGSTAEAQVSGAAMLAKGRGNVSYWCAPPNLVLRYEPTWGDVDVIEIASVEDSGCSVEILGIDFCDLRDHMRWTDPSEQAYDDVIIMAPEWLD